MGWMQKCYETYQNNTKLVGNMNDEEPLSPVAHMNATAQLEITVDLEGNFNNASVLEKQEGRIIIPVTESSAGRANEIAPHALEDTLSYVAGDFYRYAAKEKEQKKAREKFDAYLTNLQKWCDSDYSCTEIQAVYQYVKKECMIGDLIQSGIIVLEDQVFSKNKIAGKDYEKALVRFRIIGELGEPSCIWRDKKVMDDYSRYYQESNSGSRDYCYVTGQEENIAKSHPKGIVSASYSAKLVSANDKTDFTYRGRFDVPQEAYAISYEVTQKAHNALHWIAAKQGVSIGTTNRRTFVCWNPKGKKIIDIFKNPFAQEDEEEKVYNSSEYQKKLFKCLMGYGQKLDEQDDVVIMALDAATTGRLSITYYNELTAPDFYSKIREWYSSFIWYYPCFVEGKYRSEIRTPTMPEIIKYAFGTENKQGDKRSSNAMVVNDKLLKEQIQRLVYCMLNQQPFPQDIVHALFLKASAPQNNSYRMHEKILSTACAAILKRQHDLERNSYQTLEKSKEEEKMQLDPNNSNRSYLFGRLLAIAEYVENLSYTLADQEKRQSNAMKYQTAFVHHPMKTWMVLEEALRPYFSRLKDENMFKRKIDHVWEQLREEDETYLNQPLDENYLLGYYLQRNELYRKKDVKKEEEN